MSVCAVPVCRHPESEHYIYVLNGRDQSRCRACDPLVGLPPGNYVMDSDSYTAAMDRAADHRFELAPAEAGR